MIKKSQINNEDNEYNIDIESDDIEPDDIEPDDIDDMSDFEIYNIKSDDFSDYLADDFEDEISDKKIEPGYYEERPPLDMTEEDIPDFDNNIEAFKWAIANNKVIRINYVTKKGINVTRIIEPHAIKVSKGTKNNLLITYDRSVREIRTFIIDNVLNYIFTGKEFKKRIRVLPKRGVIAMLNKEKINKSFVDISNELKRNKLELTASTVNEIKNQLLNVKTAQYVGVQGYWIKNTRCWGNCYRQKRAKEPNKTAQQVWGDCWKEYNDYINDDNEEWAKYADVKNKLEKIANKDDKVMEKYFYQDISKKIKNGIPIGNAVFATIDEHTSKLSLLENIEKLLDISKTLKNNGYKKIAENIANTSNNILKTADFGGNTWDKFKNFFKKDSNKLSYRIKNLISQANDILNKIQSKVTVNASNNKFNLKKAQLNIDQRYPNAQQYQDEQKGVYKQKQQQQQFLRDITIEYNNFVSNVRSEMSYLYKMMTNNPEMQKYIQPAIESMNRFVISNNQAIQSNSLTPRFMMNSLSNLLQSLIGAGNNMQRVEQQVEREDISQQYEQQPKQQEQQPKQQEQQPKQQEQQQTNLWEKQPQQDFSTMVNTLKNNLGNMDRKDFETLKSLYYTALNQIKKIKK